MLVIDRTSERTTQQQIADYFRFEIGLGRRFKIGDTLPSTRALGTEAGVSYHTVRQAYGVLEKEGLVEGRPGSGYVVIARAALDSAQRLEKGAALVGDQIIHAPFYEGAEPHGFVLETIFSELTMNDITAPVIVNNLLNIQSAGTICGISVSER